MRRVDLADLSDFGSDDAALLIRLDGLSPDLARRAAVRLPASGAGSTRPVLIGWSQQPLPQWSEPLLKRLDFTLAPDGPGRCWLNAGDDFVEHVNRTVAHAPLASRLFARLLRVGERLDVESALEMESLAYSALLASDEFEQWRIATPARAVPASPEPVLMARDGAVLEVRLNRPERHNAFGRQVRDALLEALALAALDHSLERVELTGTGPSFCSGGDLDEFGTAGSPVAAHLVRMEQSAGLAIHRMAERVRPTLHGACIGAGIEIPSFATHVRARANAWFQLPEVSMGLIPGAGGTVSIPRRIGRWRTAAMAMSGRPIDLDTALEWGLVDECL